MRSFFPVFVVFVPSSLPPQATKVVVSWFFFNVLVTGVLVHNTALTLNVPFLIVTHSWDLNYQNFADHQMAILVMEFPVWGYKISNNFAENQYTQRKSLNFENCNSFVGSEPPKFCGTPNIFYPNFVCLFSTPQNLF